MGLGITLARCQDSEASRLRPIAHSNTNIDITITILLEVNSR